jgi:hypothetical protein
MIDVDTRSLIALAAAVAGATLIAFVLYRRTSPTIPGRLKVALGILRWLAAVLILVTVADPAVRFVRTRSTAPVLAVLVDDSRSMAYPDPRTKTGEARSALSANLIEALGRKARLRTFTFSDTLGEMGPQELAGFEPQGPRTDLVGGMTSAMKSIGGKPSAFLVVSDGAVNFGEDALHFCSALKVPVYSVSVSSAGPTPDLSIDQVEVSDVAYAGSRLPVAIYVSARHEGPVETTLAVRDSSGMVFSAPVTVAGGGARQKISAELDAGETGTHAFSASLASFPGEEVASNNSFDFAVKVIKGKIRVLLVAPHPSWDFAFASRSLAADPNMDLTVVFSPGGPLAIRSDRTAGDLSRALSNCDVVVVLGQAGIGQAAKELEQRVWKGGSLLVLSPGSWLDPVDGLDPFVTEHGAGRASGSRLMSPAPSDAGTNHEILDIDVARGGRLWSTLPPIPVGNSITGAKKEASVLISGVSGEQGKTPAVPLMAVMRYGMGRVVGFSGTDLWRWDLVPKGFGSQASAFSELLTSSVRWLAQGEQVRRLVLSTPRTSYLWGEPVALLARVVDESLKPMAGAAVETKVVDLASGKTVLDQPMAERSAGSFSRVADLLGPGRYAAKAAAKVAGKVYAEDTIVFAVSSRGLEDSGFDGDGALLDEIARATGAVSYRAGNTGDLPAALNLGSVIVKTYREIRFHLTVPSFVALAVLLGIEWFVRRRKMLA